MSTESGQRGDGNISSTPPFDASFMWTSPSPYRSRFQVPAYFPASPPQPYNSDTRLRTSPNRRTPIILDSPFASMTTASPTLPLWESGEWRRLHRVVYLLDGRPA